MGQSGIECGKIIIDFSLLSTSPEFLIDQNKFLPDLS